MSESPFVPGARVAVSQRYSDEITESFVEKVYKNGNFTLRGSKQQWKPWSHTWSKIQRWSASETGGDRHRKRLEFWDDATDKEIRAKLDEQAVKRRWRDIRSKIDGTKYPTAAMCDAIEAALTVVDSSGVRNTKNDGH
jgi:hypothetical protein